ncbi:MAG: AAA family ATPase [Zavarzinella sp.]
MTAKPASQMHRLPSGFLDCQRAGKHVDMLTRLFFQQQFYLQTTQQANKLASLPRGILVTVLAIPLATVFFCLLEGQFLGKLPVMIIAIANSKGGVGKSTLAVHLAAWLHTQGHKVILADCDTQQSSSVWIKEAAPEVTTIRLQDPEDILQELPQLRNEADFVIADGPGSNTETSRALLLRADLALVPCKASMLEVRALAKATEVLRTSQDIRHGRPEAIIILSMVGKNYRLTKDMQDAARP